MSDYLKPGIHFDVPESVYHADPCERPSLSSTIARKILNESAAHGMTAHPRLNPNYDRDEAERSASSNTGPMDKGKMVHAMVLQGAGAADIAISPYDAFRSNEAKAWRDAQLADGKIVMKEHEAAPVFDMRDSFFAQAQSIPVLRDALATTWKSEVTLVWEDDFDILCRCRIDILPAAGAYVFDYKTTGGTSHPAMWSGNMVSSMGLDIQAAFYERGLDKLGMGGREMIFLPHETRRPNAMSAVGIGPEGREEAQAEVRRALRTWKRCMDAGSWPGHPGHVYYSEPSWAARRRREMNDDLNMMTGVDDATLKLGIAMQAPSKKEQSQ